MPAMRVCSYIVVLKLLCGFESAGRGRGPLVQGSAVLFAGAVRSYRARTQQKSTVGAGHARDAVLQLHCGSAATLWF